MRWAIIKRTVSKQCGQLLKHAAPLSESGIVRRESIIWQRRFWECRFWEHQIRDDLDLQRHVDCTHWNSMKHGYIPRVIDWPYSSFYRYVQEGIYDQNWAGTADTIARAGDPGGE